MTPLRLEAPAKLNLSLAVMGQRPDGFHQLLTEMVLLQLADLLLLMPGCSGLRVEGISGEELPPATENLAWRGLLAGLERPAELECLVLEKRIPVGAGLGGGSSDAAAAWRLGRRWLSAHDAGDDADAETLARLSDIGADVPFFAAQRAAATVSGIGEVVRPGPLPAERQVVLAHPPFALSTAAVFAELRPTEWSRDPQPAGNDLLAAARRLRPELDDIIRLVAAAGGEPRLSGSGPTLFTITDDAERAARVAGRLARAGLRTTLTRIRDEAARIEAVDADHDAQEE